MLSRLVLQAETTFLFIAVLAVMYISMRQHKEGWKEEDRIFTQMLFTVGGILLIDIVSVSLNAKPGRTVHVITWVSNTLYFSLHIVPPSMFLIYAHNQLGVVRPSVRQHLFAFRLINAVWMLFCFLNYWTGLIFTVDADNVYRRGPGFVPSSLLIYAIIIYSLSMIILNKKALPRKQWLSLLFYPIPAVLGGIGQQMFYGTTLVWPATTISLLILSMNVQNDRLGSDYLTGLQNRMSLMRYIRLRLSDRRSARITCICLDLDGFKKINDTYGHAEGDRALTEAARLIRSAIREHDFLARIGGDEFVVMMETDDSAKIQEVERRIREGFAVHHAMTDKPYRLSTSLGWSAFNPKVDTGPEDFLARVDAELYKDKARREARRAIAGTAPELLPPGV